jgi:hypothetical protein
MPHTGARPLFLPISIRRVWMLSSFGYDPLLEKSTSSPWKSASSRVLSSPIGTRAREEVEWRFILRCMMGHLIVLPAGAVPITTRPPLRRSSVAISVAFTLRVTLEDTHDP